MINKIEILYPENTYHIYNRAVGSEILFKSSGNYDYFLNKYDIYISPFAETFCYCLMPNHFHFLVRIKDEKTVINSLNLLNLKSKSFEKLKNANQLERLDLIGLHISKQFSHLLNGYTQAFNNQNNRKGGLFMRPYKRILVRDNSYLKNLVNYIHNNPLEARLCPHPDAWEYSSYSSILRNENAFIKASEVIDWFGNLKNFQAFHNLSASIKDFD